nr:hypothetical protein [Methylomarinum sp. Ch1-1]MDP4520215.1 hypothetical protein [Methylomarinum sp. Ch1-1]
MEVTTLIIPGVNDSASELRDIAGFICALSPDIPWHVSQFYPAHRMSDVPVTPVKTLELAVDIGQQAGLRYVYQGNVPGGGGENSRCHYCGGILIERYGFHVLAESYRRWSVSAMRHPGGWHRHECMKFVVALGCGCADDRKRTLFRCASRSSAHPKARLHWHATVG